MFLRSSVAQDSIKSNASRLDDLQRANSTVLGGPADGPRCWCHCCLTIYAFTYAQKTYRPGIALCGSSPAGQGSPPHYVSRRERPLWSERPQGPGMEKGHRGGESEDDLSCL